jgi:phosphinothricin acetyltransferase
MDTLRPRIATVADAEAINAIYNHYVRTSAATFQVEEETNEEREEELRSRPNELPLIVLEADGEVVGWGTLSPLSNPAAPIAIRSRFRFTCGTIATGAAMAGRSCRIWWNGARAAGLSHHSGSFLRGIGRKHRFT